MADLKCGQIVRSRQGHDKNTFFVIMSMTGKYVYISNGSSRPMTSPKKKSIKHIAATARYIDTSGLTDKRLREIIRELNNEHLNAKGE